MMCYLCLKSFFLSIIFFCLKAWFSEIIFEIQNDFIQDSGPRQHQDNKPQPLQIRRDIWCHKIAKKIGLLQAKAEKCTGYQWHPREGNQESRGRD